MQIALSCNGAHSVRPGIVPESTALPCRRLRRTFVTEFRFVSADQAGTPSVRHVLIVWRRE
jgi:hypothetical protein